MSDGDGDGAGAGAGTDVGRPAGPALVLSGAGSRGAYQAGCWKALDEAGVRPALVVGTSAGALNGAMVCLGMPPDDIGRWWGRLRTRDLLAIRRDVWRWRSWLAFHDAARLRALLEENIDVEALRRTAVPFVATATDVEGGHEVVFAQQALTIDHLMASCALMPGIPPVRVEGRLHADGGHANAFPLRHALERGHRRVVALLHDPLDAHPEPAPRGLVDLLRRTSDLAWHSQQAGQMAELALRTALPPEDPRHLPPFRLDVHAPDPALSNLILRFDRKEAAELVRLGYAQTRRRLAA